MTASSAGLSEEDLTRETARFGVGDEQVLRDHAISHVLAGISRSLRDELIFFGGTALSRTHLVHARLSEDLDLIAIGDRSAIAGRLVEAIDTALLRSHGRVAWSPGFTARDVDPAVIQATSGVSLRVQLLGARGYASWPTELRRIEQRYRDAPPATLIVPTRESFVGWKTAAWFERSAPRDLYDLWALAESGAITAKAADLFAVHGPTGARPREFMFTKAPTEVAWQSSLAGQTRLTVTAVEALALVRQAWAGALCDDWK